MENIAIVVPTRNRLDHLDRLLESIQSGSEVPVQIVVVSSGQDVTSILSQYYSTLRITHSHINESGQIRQKIAGLKLLDSSIDWVFFCDDDLLFETTTIQEMRSSIAALKYLSPVGIGVKISQGGVINSPGRPRIVSRVFGLASSGFGKVNAGGLNSAYQSAEKVLETEWLNGASLWRANVAKQYNIPFLQAQYSIYEDLIFSYPIGKKNRLLFDPKIGLKFQDQETADVSSRMVFASKIYWRLFFVKSNPELSKLMFIWSQVGLTLQYIQIAHKTNLNLRQESFFALKLLMDAAYLITSNCDPLTLLRKRLGGRSF